MILYSVKDELRKEIYSLEEQEAFEFIQSHQGEYKDKYLQLLASDALKILHVKVNADKTLVPDAKAFYEFLKKAKYDEIKFCAKDDIAWFSKLFLQAKQFYILPIVDRCVLMKKLQNETIIEQLVSLDKTIILDIICYSLSKDLESINYYRQDYAERVPVTQMDSFYVIVLKIMKDLKKEDRLLFEKNYIEILRKFYMIYCYIENRTAQSLNVGLIPKKMLEKERLSLAKKIIFDTPDFFFEVLYYYFYYISNDIFDKEDIKRYCKQNVHSAMKKKLGL